MLWVGVVVVVVYKHINIVNMLIMGLTLRQSFIPLVSSYYAKYISFFIMYYKSAFVVVCI